MKIAVLGAPGSGKSEFAQALALELGWGPHDHGNGFVLDNYVTELRNTTGQEYGMLGNHTDDLTVVFKRLEWERAWINRDCDTITVGTVLDSAAHWMARSEVVRDEEAPLSQIKLQAIAATFGMLYTDTWDYDYAFLLRPSEFPDGVSYQRSVQYTLEALAITYRAPVFHPFDNPEASSDEKAKLAADTIRALEEEPIAPPQERGVRGSGEDGEADGDSSEPVPDVPEQGTD